MRAFEIVLIVVIVAAAAGIILMKKDRRLNTGLLLAVVIAMGLHGLIEHYRIQMAPAYAAAAGILIVLILRLVKPERRNRPYSQRKPSGYGYADLSKGGTVSAGNRRMMDKEKYINPSIIKKSLQLLLVLILSGAAAYLSILLPVFTLPEPTGSYAIGTVTRQLTDHSRGETLSAEEKDKRELMVNVWYPVDPEDAEDRKKEHYPSALGDAISLVFGLPKLLFSHLTEIPTHVVDGVQLSAAQASYPVLLFSPGIRSTRFQSMSVIEELVSHGYIVVGMDHPYTSAKVTYPDGHSVFYVPDPQFETSGGLYNYNIEGIAVRAADASFVLDTLTAWNKQDPNNLFQGKLDLSRAGIFGHSYGGATTAEALARDKRFKAGVSLEGGFWGEVAHTGLKQPFMYMMTGGTAQSLDPAVTKKDKVFYEEFAPDLDAVMTRSTGDTYYLTIDHFIHQSFTEIALLSPALFANGIDPVHTVDITRSYVRAFFDQYLQGNPQTLLDGPSAEYPEVRFDQKYTRKRQ